MKKIWKLYLSLKQILFHLEILKITNKPVSCEVFADDEKGMISQGLKISKWGKNIFSE